MLALGRIGDALEMLTHGLEANPDEPRLLLQRGRSYIPIRKFDVAARDLRKAAETLPAARCALGLAQYLSADYARAQGTYGKCADPGVFGYLAARRAGGAADLPSCAHGPAADPGDHHQAPRLGVSASRVRRAAADRRQLPRGDRADARRKRTRPRGSG